MHVCVIVLSNLMLISLFTYISDFRLLDIVLSKSFYRGKLTIKIICEFHLKMVSVFIFIGSL